IGTRRIVVMIVARGRVVGRILVVVEPVRFLRGDVTELREQSWSLDAERSPVRAVKRSDDQLCRLSQGLVEVENFLWAVEGLTSEAAAKKAEAQHPDRFRKNEPHFVHMRAELEIRQFV